MGARFVRPDSILRSGSHHRGGSLGDNSEATHRLTRLAMIDSAPKSTLLRRHRPCRSCGYDLFGQVFDGRCPECGTAVVSVGVRIRSVSKIRWNLRWLYASFGLYVLFGDFNPGTTGQILGASASLACLLVWLSFGLRVRLPAQRSAFWTLEVFLAVSLVLSVWLLTDCVRHDMQAPPLLIRFYPFFQAPIGIASACYAGSVIPRSRIYRCVYLLAGSIAIGLTILMLSPFNPVRGWIEPVIAFVLMGGVVGHLAWLVRDPTRVY